MGRCFDHGGRGVAGRAHSVYSVVMEIGIGVGGVLVLLFVVWVAFKALKSLLKAMTIGFVILLALGVWLAYSFGAFR